MIFMIQACSSMSFIIFMNLTWNNLIFLISIVLAWNSRNFKIFEILTKWINVHDVYDSGVEFCEFRVFCDPDVNK